MKKADFFLLIIIAVLIQSCRSREAVKTESEIARVRVTGISRDEISIPVHSTGILVSTEELKLSFKTGGIVASVRVNEGDRVKKGQLLASLNLAEISANVKQAGNGYEKALRDFTRAENLYRDSVATLEQKQNAATALDVAKSTLEIARFNLEHSSIISPGNGVILKQLVHENELVSSGYPVFLFGQSGKYWKVKSGLSDRDIVRVRRGDSAVISFDAYPGVTFRAAVEQIGEMADPLTGTYETELIVEAGKYKLVSGFVADVTILPSPEGSFSMVPVGSIVEADGQTGYVYGLTDSSTVQKIKISIETVSGSSAAISGLPAGISEIVSEGAAYLRNGMKVLVVK